MGGSGVINWVCFYGKDLGIGIVISRSERVT